MTARISPTAYSHIPAMVRYVPWFVACALLNPAQSEEHPSPRRQVLGILACWPATDVYPARQESCQGRLQRAATLVPWRPRSNIMAFALSDLAGFRTECVVHKVVLPARYLLGQARHLLLLLSLLLSTQHTVQSARRHDAES